jgi:TRAP transporter 4TM/12TM fusion protein
VTKLRRIDTFLDRGIVGVAVLMALYHMVASQYIFFGPFLHQNIHLALACIILILVAMKRWPRLRPPLLIFLPLVVASTLYIHVFYDELVLRRGFATPLEMVVSAIILIAVFLTSYVAFGLPLVVVGAAIVSYIFFGHYLPPPFDHMPLPLPTIMFHLASGFEGVYGPILGASANYIFLFVLFGGLLEASGGVQCFLELGKAVGRKLKGGPALLAIVGSAMVGTVTGSVSANIALTGAFSIPLMKKVGYKPQQAGGIEVVASTGGQIMPPVMGASGFLMSAFLVISYVSVIRMAVIPALIYFLALGFCVQFMAVKMNVIPMKEPVNYQALWASLPLFVIPISTMLVLLLEGYTPMYAAFWSILAVLAVANIRKRTRSSFRQWLQGMVRGVQLGAMIGVTCALVGPLVTSVTMTGLGLKIASTVEVWSRGYLVLALLMTMVLSIILSTGLPTSAGYAIVALVVAPTLVRMGLAWEQAHFFVLYFAVFSFFTPPVATGALVAAGLAGASFAKTAWEGMKMGILLLLIPYMFVLWPELLLLPSTKVTVLSIVMLIVSIILMLMTGAITLYRSFLTKLRPVELVLSIVAMVGCAGYIYARVNALFILGITLFALQTIIQVRKKYSNS